MTDMRDMSDMPDETIPEDSAETFAEPSRELEPLAEAMPTADLTASPEPSETASPSDLSRTARAAEFRTQRRLQVSTVIPALLLIGLGILYITNDLTPLTMFGTAVIALAVGLIMRYFLNGARESGLFFLGVLILLWAGVVAAGPLEIIDLAEGWPLFISAIGGAMLVTVIFQRSHEMKLVLAGVLIIFAGLVIMPFTLGYFDPDFLPSVAVLWPLLLIIVILVILPRVIRRRE